MVTKTLAVAQSLLTKAHCGLGTVTRKYAPYAKGMVIRQSLAFGAMRAVGTKIQLTVSLGPTG
jgi:beta-lactam-binding protein with PASTA domain